MDMEKNMDMERNMDMEKNMDMERNMENMTEARINEYVDYHRINNRMIGIGVALILLGITCLIAVGYNVDGTPYEALCIIPLFLGLIPAVGIFVYRGIKSQAYEFIEKGQFQLDENMRNYVTKRLAAAQTSYPLHMVVSICILVASPVPLLVSSIMSETFQVYAVCILLLMVALGVFIIINTCGVVDACKNLLQNENTASAKATSDKIISIVSSIVWPITVLSYLLAGFIANAWGTAWVVFPVVGICFGIFSAIVNGVTNGIKNM